MSNFGFIILSPESHFGQVKVTVNLLKKNYKNTSIVIVVPKSCSKSQLEELKQLCPTHRGKNTITSLINTGFKFGHKDRNIILFEGTCIHANTFRRYETLPIQEKEIIYPIVVNYDIQGKPVKIFKDFWESSLNGLMIHTKTFKEVGDFGDDNLEKEKLIWGVKAAELGCTFKAVLGVKLI